MKAESGRVYLVGAGCGDADLITVRGLRCLSLCDAVVYDDLIAEELLESVPPHAETICMGKRGGRPSASQEDICKVLIAKAREGKTVVRLKGGDPFVFGRGGEEILALREAGIPYEEVPGISSAIAIPAAAGIPVTHRGVSQSFHVITAHTARTPDGLPAYFDGFAKLPGTLVFLMGLAQLPRIAQRLMDAGMASATPAAVVSGGNSPYPAAVRGTLADIPERMRQAGVRSPAVIVVGGAAALDCSATIPRPLAGVRVGITGTAAITEKLRPALRALGARVFCAERSLVEELPFDFPLDTLRGKRCWIVITSGNGVRLFFRHLRRQRMDLRRLHSHRFAVIGAATAEALEHYGIRADLCPEVYTSEGLGDALWDAVEPGESVYLFRSAHGSKPLARRLAERFPVRDVPLYSLRADPQTAARAQNLLPGADYLTFSSASGVELFFAAHGAIPESAVCVCIGEVTASALRRRYNKPFLVASSISAEGIVEAVLKHRESG